MTMTRERERGSSSRRRARGREREDGHRDVRRLEPRGSSAGLSALGRQMTSGLTCDTLSCRTKNKSMVLLCALSGLSLRFQRCDLWLRPPSSSLSVVSWRETCGRLRLRELIRWREPDGSWSLSQSG
ncbi:uncharacterized protein PEZ65_022229 [Lycodopsis pacificus]